MFLSVARRTVVSALFLGRSGTGGSPAEAGTTSGSGFGALSGGADGARPREIAVSAAAIAATSAAARTSPRISAKAPTSTAIAARVATIAPLRAAWRDGIEAAYRNPRGSAVERGAAEADGAAVRTRGGVDAAVE